MSRRSGVGLHPPLTPAPRKSISSWTLIRGTNAPSLSNKAFIRTLGPLGGSCS